MMGLYQYMDPERRYRMPMQGANAGIFDSMPLPAMSAPAAMPPLDPPREVGFAPGMGPGAPKQPAMLPTANIPVPPQRPTATPRQFYVDRGDGSVIMPHFSKDGVAPEVPGATVFEGPIPKGLFGGMMDRGNGVPMGGLATTMMNDKGNFRGVLPLLFGGGLSMDQNDNAPGLFSGVGDALSGLFGGLMGGK